MQEGYPVDRWVRAGIWEAPGLDFSEGLDNPAQGVRAIMHEGGGL